MRIVANKIVTKWELETGNLPSNEWTKIELFHALGGELRKYPSLFFENKIDGNIEFQAEMFVFSKQTFDVAMKQLRGILSEGEFERVKNIFMNTI